MKYLLVLCASLLIVSAGMSQPKRDSTKAKSKTTMTISEVLKKYTDKWMAIPGVLGTGEGRAAGKPCVTVYLDKESDTIRKSIPKVIDGYQVVFQVTGPVEAR